jgi:hypothetical protein
MGLKFLKIKGSAILLLACLMVLVELPASAGQRHGRGRGHGRGGVVIVRGTPGIPASSRGRGRNWTPRTPRRRYVRTVIRHRRNRRNLMHVTPRRRRVRRGHIMH